MKIGIDVRALKETAGNEYLLYGDSEITLPYQTSKFKQRIFKASEVFWYFKVWRDLRSQQVDYFYSTHSTIFSFFPLTKTILIVHDLSAILFPQLHTFKVRILAGKFFLTHACRRAKFIFADSEATRNDLENIIPVSIGKITVNYCGLSLDKKSDSDKNRFIDYNFPYILYLGTIEPRKNLVRLIEAYNLLFENNETHPKLVIAGNTGWYYQEVFQKVVELNLQNEVIFTGFVNETEKNFLFKNALFFVFPSIYEGFGLPVAEAMKRGIPVLTSGVSSLPEIVGKDYSFLVDPEDVSDIKSKLEKLLQLTPKEKEKLVLENKRKISQFSWEKNAVNWLKVIS